jgi:hypothetical protein
MLILSNGVAQEMFSCHLELIEFLGEETFNAVLEGYHSQFTLSYVPIT